MAVIKREISDEKLNHYFTISEEAIEKAESALDNERKDLANEFLSMAKNYYEDAKHFKNEGDYVLAFAALNYAHGWLDSGAKIRLFKVYDSRLFTVDEESDKDYERLNK